MSNGRPELDTPRWMRKGRLISTVFAAVVVTAAVLWARTYDNPVTEDPQTGGAAAECGTPGECATE